MGQIHVSRRESISQRSDKESRCVRFHHGRLLDDHQSLRRQTSQQLRPKCDWLGDFLGLHLRWHSLDDFIRSFNPHPHFHVHRTILTDFQSVQSSSIQYEKRADDFVHNLVDWRLDCCSTRHSVPLIAAQILRSPQRRLVLSALHPREISAWLGLFSIRVSRNQSDSSASHWNSLYCFALFNLANKTCNNFEFPRLRVRHKVA